MPGLRWLQMTDDEIDEFLGHGGTGVLSFSTNAEDSPASIPVSYGYNAGDTIFYFRLSVPPDSRKTDLVDTKVTFVTYDETDEGWRSIVATGRLDDLEEMPYESSAIQGMWAIQMPRVDIFEQPRDEVTFHDFCLAPETLTGRKEVQAES
ncbi:pyridoxamine 5'-phosphate oxidase family protein [Natribaculum luteum]|uniref:Pyridoxamine 5'-phosphate oxidase family protein n=1 Tax=Natribaculum luteum TaxID=1586232 RepID=A0ABD5NVD7_9EURY|nr:pyridoxamine 5'-phosphate oxidase family protein [Natribaculum luteum]